MNKSNLPLHFQELEIEAIVEYEEEPHVSISSYQTTHFFPQPFYKPILSYIGPRYFEQENEH